MKGGLANIPLKAMAATRPSSCGSAKMSRWACCTRIIALPRGEGLANRHGPTFHLGQRSQIRTSPTACLRVTAEIRAPQHQHSRGKDKAQKGFYPALAIPRPRPSDVDIRPSCSTACDRCRALPEQAFRCPGAQSPADCRTAPTHQGHYTAGSRSKLRKGSFVHSDVMQQFSSALLNVWKFVTFKVGVGVGTADIQSAHLRVHALMQPYCAVAWPLPPL